MTKKATTIIIAAVVVVVALVLIANCFYTIGETEKGVLTTFGKVTAIQNAGLNFKLPDPIQHIDKVDMTTRKLTLGYSETESGYVYVNEYDAKMITGDYNIVAVDFFIEWKVSDPQKFLFNSQDPIAVLENIAKAAARDVVGSYDVDNVLTDGKVTIQSSIRDLMSQRVSQYDIGIQIFEVKIQDAEPPTNEVTTAFKDVETAKQTMETTINQATAYKNTVIPSANAQADKIIKDAEAYRQERINAAMGAAAKFSEMYAQYKLNPEITRKRLYLEMMEDVLPGVMLYIDTSNGGVDKLLPIEPIVEVK